MAPMAPMVLAHWPLSYKETKVCNCGVKLFR